MPGVAAVYQISGHIHRFQNPAEIFPFQMYIGRHLTVYKFIHLFFLLQKQGNIPEHLGGKLGISLFALCNLICAIATNYMVFLVFRILTAVVSGTVVSISMTYAEDVASIPEHIPGVIAGVFSGFSIASVIGVPIASTITHVFGWRAAFITIFVATLALLALLFMKLPRQNRLKAGSILEQFKLFLDKRISIGCAIVFLAGASTYCFYTYLTPIFQQGLHIPDSMLSLALLIFGIAAGSAMGGVIVKYTGLRFVGIGGAIPGIGAIICAVILLQIMKPGADIR